MIKRLFKKTGVLIRFTLRRDRIRISVWLMSLFLVTISVAPAFTQLYSSKVERDAIAGTMVNPAMIAMVGKVYGLDNYTTGSMMAHQMLLFTALTVGIMSILLVTRQTRGDEEDGRIELIRSLPTGRLSNIAASLIVVCGANILLAFIIGIGLSMLGIESMDLTGSLLYGAALGVVGIFFAATTAVMAQLSESSRGTISLSFIVLGLAYVIRAIGDVGNATLSWFSPFGWTLGTEVYVNNYWWPVFLTIGVSILLVVLALYLNSIRDLGSGFIHAKPGRKYASRFLQSPFGLALRIQRTTLIAWAIGMFLLGIAYGSILGDLETFLEDMTIIEDMIPMVEGFSLTEQFLTMLMSVMALISTIPVLITMLKLYGEERKNRIEPLLSRAVSRGKLFSSYFVLSFITSFVMVSLAVLGLWLSGVAVMDDVIAFNTMYSAIMVYLPAMWIMIGLAALLIGFLPRLSGFIWIYLVYSFIVIYLGGLLQLPDWLNVLSPFGYIPQMPVEEVDLFKISMLIIIAVVITTIGFIGFRNRDIQG